MSHLSPSRGRTGTASLAFGLAAAIAGTLLVGAAPASAAEAPSDEAASRFTFAVLPDTQFYSRYAQSNFVPDYGTDPFAVQTQWLADHAADLNLAFTSHVGDIVDQVGVAGQWETASDAMANLEAAGLSYSILAGNHDVRNASDSVVDTDYDLANEPFLQHFGTARDAEQATYGGADPTGMNRFHVFEAEGQEFLVLAISWRASDATLEWANGVIDAHPTLPVILTSHDLLAIENDGITGRTSDNGERLWNALINENDQIFLTVNGHYHGAAVTERTNASGNTVTQVLMDYQMAYEGGNGYLGLFEFDLTHEVIDVATVSPWVSAKPSDRLTTFDEPVLDGAAQRFAIDLEGRFDGFAPDFGPGSSALPSLTERAIALITDGFEGVPPTTNTAAGNADDYVEAEGTLAHWQMSGATGVLDEGGVIEDLAGDNDLARATLAESGSAAAQVDDVTIVDDAHQYSASAQSVCFDNSDQTAGRYSYLSTASDAAVNDADLSAGYTIETFMLLDDDWTAEANGWSKGLVRSGNRSQIDGMPWSQWDYTASPAALGISNLREFQWTEVGNDATKGDKTNWSGEIMVGTWSHVAIVNDPATAETTMYVNGAPVLRTGQDTIGMSYNEGMPWVIGSDWVDDAARNGWHGCIGETRIVDRPLAADEWLTARPDLSSFAVTSAPEGELPAEQATATLTGTGAPRAVVAVDGPDASAVVAADGTWAIDVPVTLLTAGDNVLSLTQGFGERRSDAVDVTIRVAAGADAGAGSDDSASADAQAGADGDDAGVDGADAAAGGATTDGATSDSAAADGATGTDEAGDNLVSTGGSTVLFIAFGAVLLALAGGVVLHRVRRRA